jgi:MerR family transcriptional regulator, repressor of the yfmOP operon
VGAGVSVDLARIGELAAELGVSTRTLRYYEELGLLRPSAHSSGGSRRYAQEDRERLLRIRDLQSVMGFNLEEIRQILGADDRIAELRTEYTKGVTPKRHRDILIEAARLNAETQAKVRAKIGVLDGFLAELRERADRYQQRADELGVVLPTVSLRKLGGR